jgi:hypothetical protein
MIINVNCKIHLKTQSFLIENNLPAVKSIRIDQHVETGELLAVLSGIICGVFNLKFKPI